MSRPLLTGKQITKTYQMGDIEVTALRGVDITLNRGEFVVLLGHSGSGKSTLVNILGGLDNPTSGEVWMGDERIDQYSTKQLTEFRRQYVGFVFQMYNLIPRLNAEENIKLVTEITDNPLDAKAALELVGLGHRAQHFPAQMSGGEQQRVAIARAIAKQPRILLCDEPTGALDIHTGILVLNAIQGINERLGTTTIVITHNQVIAELADRVITLVDGRVADIRQNSIKRSPRDLTW